MNNELQSHTILGQKYAYATAALMIGIFSFINLAGMEKALLAITFAALALRKNPQPVLQERRVWAKVGLGLGLAVIVIVPVVIIFYFERLREIIEVLSKLNAGR